MSSSGFHPSRAAASGSGSRSSLPGTGPRSQYSITIAGSDGNRSWHPAPNPPSNAAVKSGTYSTTEADAPGSSKELLYCTKLMETIKSQILRGQGYGDDVNFTLRSLPSGYQVYTTTQFKGGEKSRFDSYLHGHPSGRRFRSTKEFEPHALYLVRKYGIDGLPTPYPGKGEDSRPCSCQLCSGSSNDTMRSKKSKLDISGKGDHDEDDFTDDPRYAAIKQAMETEQERDLEELRSYPRKNEIVLAKVQDTLIPSIVLEPYGDQIKLQRCGSDDKIYSATRNNVTPWNVKPGSADVEIDNTSLKAAAAIERSVTLIGPGELITGEFATESWHYSGVFIGAEKIWNGDLVRLPGRDSRTDAASEAIKKYPYGSEDIMYVHRIRHTNGQAQDPATGELQSVSHIFLEGPVFTNDKEKSHEMNEEATAMLDYLLCPPSFNKTWRSQMTSPVVEKELRTKLEYPGPWRSRTKAEGPDGTDFRTASIALSLVRGRFYPLSYLEPMLEDGGMVLKPSKRPPTTFKKSRASAFGVSRLNDVDTAQFVG